LPSRTLIHTGCCRSPVINCVRGDAAKGEVKRSRDDASAGRAIRESPREGSEKVKGMNVNDKPPFDYLLAPVISEAERAMILLQMARVGYTEWAKRGSITPDWDALNYDEKERWGHVVREATRAMLNLHP
jgi:hypothetical protein